MKYKITLLAGLSCVLFSAQQGKVGINTDNPTATLDIVSKANTNATKALKISNSSTTEMVTVRDNGQVGINQATPATDALLELNATNKALLLTRVTNATDVANPVNGMLVYDITQHCVRSYENAAWSGCLSAGGSGGGGTTTLGGGALLCDNNAFINPISIGTQSTRGNTYWNYIDEEPMILDASGKKFYRQTQNFFYDLDINNLYAAAGISPGTYTAYKFPTNYYFNSYGHWIEVKIFGQLYPTKTWKQYLNYSCHRYDGAAAHVYPDYWALLLSTDGELKAVRYQKRAETWGWIYPGISGRDGVGKNVIAASSTMNPTDFYVTTDIKAYSDINTPTTTNWTWVEPYTNGNFNYSNWTTEFISAALAYNAADNLWYSWGAKDVTGSQYQADALPNILLRTTPTSVTQSMTPLPATILNSLLTTLGTTVKMPTEDFNTIMVTKKQLDTYPALTFITANNKVIRYNLSNGNYAILSLPAGVNPVSLDNFYASGLLYDVNSFFVLGSDGKVYKPTSNPTAVAQTANITTYAHSIWSTGSYPVVKQFVKGIFIDQDGKIGKINDATTLTFPVNKQTSPTKRILLTYSSTYDAKHLFVDQAGNFGEYADSNGPVYNQNGYNGGKLGNYLYNRQTNWVFPSFVESFQFYPSKCTTY